jgi:hypothetical protein
MPRWSAERRDVPIARDVRRLNERLGVPIGTQRVPRPHPAPFGALLPLGRGASQDTARPAPLNKRTAERWLRRTASRIGIEGGKRHATQIGTRIGHHPQARMREAGAAGAAGGIQRGHVRVRSGNPRLDPGRRRAASPPTHWLQAGQDLLVVVPAERVTSTIARLAQERARAGTHVSARLWRDGSRIGPSSRPWPTWAS